MRFPPKPIDFAPATLTIKQAQQYTGLCATTLYNKINDGTLPKVKIGTRTLIPRESLDRMLGLEQ